MDPKVILDYWFPNEKYQAFWFDKTPDEYIKQNFSDLLQKAEEHQLDHWKESQDGLLALIILLDQFTRNIYRDTPNAYKNDKIALDLAVKAIDNNQDLKYPLCMRFFILLPLRHQKNTMLLDKVMNRLALYSQEKDIDTVMLKRFKLATLKSYTDITDEIKVITDEIKEINSLRFDNDVLDNNCNKYDKLVSVKDCDRESELYGTIKRFCINNKIKKIGISLSGGVDSMVLCYVLKILEHEKIIDSVVAIHIEYNNRKESEQESIYITNWCRYMNIPLILRKVSHMTRDNVDRNFYEEETKNIRVKLYKYAIVKYNLQGICLGHHSDDISENVLMNVLKGRNLLDLQVMTPESILSQVKIYRPMLNHEKQDIFDFAHKFNIPYMKDTTPDWSCRGVYRRKMQPIMIEQYGTGVTKNILDIGNQSFQWNMIVNNLIFEPIIKSITYTKLGIIIPIIDSYKNMPPVFWSKIFIECFHKSGNKMITSKNLDVFIEWIKCNKDTKIKFSNGFYGVVDDMKILLFNKEFNDNITETKTLGFKSEFKIGHWNVVLKEIQDNKDKKVIYEDIITGKYQFTVNLTDSITINNIKKHDGVRKIFSKVNLVSNNIIKIASQKDKSKLYLVTVTYE
jgi:tRNA(Ile)-lysidine synthetase-like protein